MQRVGAQSHGAGGDDKNLTAREPGIREIFDQRGNTFERESAVSVEEEVRAQLHYYATYFQNPLAQSVPVLK